MANNQGYLRKSISSSLGKFYYHENKSWHARVEAVKELEKESETAWNSFTEAHDNNLNMNEKGDRYQKWCEIHLKKKNVLKNEKRRLFIQHSDDMDKIENRSFFIKLMSSLKSRQSRTTCRLNSNKLPEHSEYFKETTFGANPEEILNDNELQKLNDTNPEDIDMKRELTLFTRSNVEEIIRKLPNGMVVGIDVLKNEVITTSIHLLVDPLTKFFNILPAVNCIPTDWKIAYIVPVFKKRFTRRH